MKSYSILLVALLPLAILSSTATASDDTTFGGTGHGTVVPGGSPLSPPSLVISFSDAIPMHNMGIASDDTHYYTCNGGSSSVGQINIYDHSGAFILSTAVTLSMRAVLFNPLDDQLYTKANSTDLYQVDPVSGNYSILHSGIFAANQSSVAITPDGLTLIENSGGTVYFYSFATGALLDTITGFNCGAYPTDVAVGTDGERIFTWDGTQVWVYEMDGTPIENYSIPNGHYGFSLKFVNGLLFTSDDGGGGTGTWYGYDVGETPLARSTWATIKSSFE